MCVVTVFMVMIADTKLGPFWAMILDSSKQWIVSDKFLASATDESKWLSVLVRVRISLL